MPVLDLRPLPPPERHRRVQEQAFTWEAEALDGGDWRVVFRQAS